MLRRRIPLPLAGLALAKRTTFFHQLGSLAKLRKVEALSATVSGKLGEVRRHLPRLVARASMGLSVAGSLERERADYQASVEPHSKPSYPTNRGHEPRIEICAARFEILECAPQVFRRKG